MNLCVKVAQELIMGVALIKSSDKFSEKKLCTSKLYVVKTYAKNYCVKI